MEQSKENRPDTGIKALLKRAPVHYRLFCTKPKNGPEWRERVVHWGMYICVFLVTDITFNRDDYVTFLKVLGLLE
ncbi:MAG: hypothetical protein KDA87_22125 [Planctomycetales bacterium]|nr:hypothetical protein [Planctomycetales bacterium]